MPSRTQFGHHRSLLASLVVRLAVLASGSGTLLESMVAADLPVEHVIVDRPCRAADVARDAGIPVDVIERIDFSAAFDRDSYTRQLIDVLVDRDIGLIAMAGFGTVLAPSAFEAFPNGIINTHPALLPSFKGWHAVPDALAAGVKVTGCTVHVATAQVDDGPILAQEAVPVLADDDEERLHERIKVVERRLYIDTIRSVLDDPTQLKGT
jgi:phosphoribosylglycinamide formyltransferase-1